MLTLVFDTETTGFVDRCAPLDAPGQPGICELGAILFDGRRAVFELGVIIQPRGAGGISIMIPAASTAIHGIDDALAGRVGFSYESMLRLFRRLVDRADRLVAFNAAFDAQIIQIACNRIGLVDPSYSKPIVCAMLSAAQVLKLPGRVAGEYAWPKLDAAYRRLVEPGGFVGAHSALADTRACASVLFALEDGGAELVEIAPG